MPELLLELFCEEIPARFQRRAADDLKKAVTGGLVEQGLLYEGAAAFVTPRRLALTVKGVAARSPDIDEERRGPKVGAPAPAIAGFLRATGLTSIDQAEVKSDPKKGEYYVARIARPGRLAEDILTGLIPEVISGFPWPKSMRWGDGNMQWVRPLRAITATFGAENEEPVVLDFAVDGLEAGRTSYGHRFLAPGPIRVRRFDDYLTALERAKVVLDLDRRKQIIRTDAENLAFAQGLTLIADEGLIEETAGLVEWPVPMLGRFDEAFLAVPEEVIILTIRANQKCFCLRQPDGRLADRFILVANTIPEDDGAMIVAGNERVIRARLSDAKYFYDADLAIPLADLAPRLADIVFHARLGSQAERVGRLEALAERIAPLVGAEPGLARRAARLAKADLVTQMVGEFPELQGVMGRYYAMAQGEHPSVATAIADHYKPLGPTDRVPDDPVAIAVALADKLDLLAGFWAIDEKPTGSRDPFALRRAALGIIRIILDNDLSVRLVPLIAAARGGAAEAGLAADLLAFFHDRLKVSLRESGARYDLVDAVIGPDSDDLRDIVRRVAALSEFLDSEDGRNLLTGYRRAANILADEEKKDGRAYGGPVTMPGDPIAADYHLRVAVEGARGEVAARVAEADYQGAMEALATLRRPVDNFFEAVMVNADDPAQRRLRLDLLANLRAVMHEVADFSKVVG